MVRLVRVFLLFSVALGLFASLPMVSQAARTSLNPIPAKTAAAPLNQATVTPVVTDSDTVTFAQLGAREDSMEGPFNARYINVRLPSTWQLEPGAAITLDFETFVSGSAVSSDENVQFFAGSMDVQFNNVQLERIFLDRSGSRSVTIPISQTAYTSTRVDGAHTLGILLDAGLNCGNDSQTSVIIRATSSLKLPHSLGTLSTDIKQLPRPIFQDSPLEPDVATIVVPSNASAAELEAGLIVAAKVGSITSSRIQVPLIAESVLSPTLRSESHLIFVGQAANFENLAAVDFAEGSGAEGFKLSEAQAADGIIQMATSPWNQQRVVLALSGNDDEGVIKAAKAFSTGNVRASNDPSIAVVADVNSPDVLTKTLNLQITDVPSTGLTVERTFRSLGFESVSEFGIGGHTFELNVDMPSGYEMSNDGYIEVHFAHSALLDYSVSAMMVRVNDRPAGSIRFDDTTSQNGVGRVPIPRGNLNVGRNRITISANLIPNTPCVDPNLAGIWYTLRADSMISIPVRATRGRSIVLRNLATFLEPLTISNTLKNIAFVVPSDDPTSWTVAGQLATALGDSLDPAFVELRAVNPEQVASVQANHDLVLVGQAPAHAILQDPALQPIIPAPFAQGSKHPTLGNSRVVYRIPPELSLGYLEFMRSPWNEQRSILAVLGSTDQGVQWSGNALTTSRLRTRLNGSLAIVNDQQISVEDPTVTGDTAGIANDALGENQDDPIYREVTPPEKPQWILYAIAGLLVLMVIISVIVIIQAARNRKQRRI